MASMVLAYGVLGLLAAIAVAACSAAVSVPEGPFPIAVRAGEPLAARVGPEALPARLVDQDVSASLALLRAGSDPEGAAARRWDLTQRWITRLLAAQEARRRGISITREEVERALRTGEGLPRPLREYYRLLRERHGVAREDLLIRVQLDLYLFKLRDQLVEEVRSSLREEDVWGFYRSHRAVFRRPEQIYVWLIAVRDRDLARRIAKRARAGEEFAALAEQYSVHPSRVKKGEFGWLGRGGSAFEPLFELSPGEVSDPIPYQGFWLVVKVTARRPAGVWRFEDVKQDVERVVIADRVRERQAQLDRELRARTRVEVFVPQPKVGTSVP